jgi:hypothetical protein
MFANKNYSEPWWQTTATQPMRDGKTQALINATQEVTDFYDLWFPDQTRGYPDISALATKYMVLMVEADIPGIDLGNGKDGQFSVIDGTSLSTPVIASLIANLNDIRHTRGLSRFDTKNSKFEKRFTKVGFKII